MLLSYLEGLNDDDFTYTNGYKAWAGAIFVDLRDSTKLFSKEKVGVSKVTRGLHLKL
ncbi:hypothetical protein US8_03749 [Bacillus altitudinis]|nr:hypothetical protein US8_03749 [Bacillus altitudinis]